MSRILREASLEREDAQGQEAGSRRLRRRPADGSAKHRLLIRKDGSELPIDSQGAPIRDDGGGPVGVVLVFQDISQRRAMERELSRKTEALVEANARKDEFLSMLAHELRNPLAPLRTGAHLLHRLPASSPQAANIGRMIERQVSHLARLVEDVVDLAQMTRGSIVLRREPIALAALIDQAVEMNRGMIEARNHGLHIENLAPALVVDGDPARLVQVFGNLLSNAVRFTEPGGRIEISVRQERAEAVVSVRDNGQGISAKLLPRVFDFFVQADRSLDRAHGGLGIGLSFVQALVERHGGGIDARSAGPGQGSEFVVRLPALIVAESGAAEVGGGLPVEGDRSGGVPGSNGAAELRSRTASVPGEGPLRVLVVDDNEDAAQSLRVLLEHWGHEVESAHGPFSALEIASRFEPQVLLLDVGLPGMSGYELARRLREMEGLDSSLLVALTGYGRPEDRQRSAEAGFDHHLTKPVDPDVLQRLLSCRSAGQSLQAQRDGPDR